MFGCIQPHDIIQVVLKIAYSTRPNISPWGTALMIDYHFGFDLLITTPQAWQSSQFSTRFLCTLSNLTSLSARMLWYTVKQLDKIKIADISCSPFIHWASCFSLKNSQVRQACFTLGKSMLAFSSHFFVLHVNMSTHTNICSSTQKKD